MTKQCLDSNLLNNSGTSQQQRALAALAALYAQVDERKISDLILFAKKYGAYLNYYELTNTIQGNWQSFMSKDIAVTLATVASYNTNDYFSYIKNLSDYILIPPSGTPPTIQEIQSKFKYFFDFLASLAYSLNQALINIPSGSDYYTFLNVSIGSKLATPLWLLQDYYVNYLNTTSNVYFPLALPPDPASPADNSANISSISFLTSAPWLPPAAAIPTPNPLYSISFDPTGGTLNDVNVYKQIASSSVFTGTVNSFLNGVAFIVNQTQSTYLQEIISQYPDHTPHYALYLAFLQLFQSAQQHLNEYTGRHLKFYYEKVLQLKPDNGVPDDVHVAFTLQKNTDQHLIPKGTELNAGKDAKNNPLYYALTDDIVLNQASIQDIKSLYLLKANTPPAVPAPGTSYNGNKNLFASPIANSADGAGGKITAPDSSWFPFGDITNTVFNSAIPNIGFAVASGLFYMNEGERYITVTFNCNSDINIPSGLDLNKAFSAQFTGNKKWFNASDYAIPGEPAVSVYYYGSTLNLYITISGSAPPVVPYSQKIHGGNWPQALPMLQITLTDMSYYSVLKSLQFSTVDLMVYVNNVKNLVVQNDGGKVDPSKSFKPFGAFADKGQGSLIIGNKEIFQKPDVTVYLNLDMYFPNAATTYLDVGVSLLTGGQWQPIPSDRSDTFLSIPLYSNEGTITIGSTGYNTTDYQLDILATDILNTPVIPTPDFTPNEAYTPSSENGFIMLTNQTDLSLYTYLQGLTLPTVTATTDTSTNTTTYSVSAPPPSTPPSPTINSITIDYGTDSEIAFNELTPAAFANRSQFFYHIEPFGFREIHPFLFQAPAEIDLTEPDNQMNVLPVFNLDSGVLTPTDTGIVSSPDNGGELWIGLAGAVPGETHSILFQVSEGSSNPLKNTTTVSWYYLSSNNWISINDTVVDQTNNLSQSGLVVLPLPGDETLNNTRADSSLVWIKAVVQGNTDAICRIISIIPNAAKATFVQNIPANIEFSGNIPASTISKLAVADGTIKQVSQPYPSFGGMLPENNRVFDQRVSERLRHKNRAVTAWDYGRLVLQNFPQIHKVKCLNHTDLNTNTGAYSELKPGHVMIVTVPNLELLTGANPYLPFTNIGLLEDIRKFIAPLTSPFVDLELENPQFEGIQFDFSVSFKKGFDVNYYKGQLNTDIMNFLMPWASGSQTKDIEFGGSIEKATVLNFVQQRSYVDHVTDFVMNQFIYGENGFPSSADISDVDVAVATTARSILVPYYVPGINPLSNIIQSPATC